MKVLTTLLLAAVSLMAFGQDYVMYETHYLSVKPGNEDAAMEAIERDTN